MVYKQVLLSLLAGSLDGGLLGQCCGETTGCSEQLGHFSSGCCRAGRASRGGACGATSTGYWRGGGREGEGHVEPPAQVTGGEGRGGGGACGATSTGYWRGGEGRGRGMWSHQHRLLEGREEEGEGHVEPPAQVPYLQCACGPQLQAVFDGVTSCYSGLQQEVLEFRRDCPLLTVGALYFLSTLF